jgi:hypothetical protein
VPLPTRRLFSQKFSAVRWSATRKLKRKRF